MKRNFFYYFIDENLDISIQINFEFYIRIILFFFNKFWLNRLKNYIWVKKLNE